MKGELGHCYLNQYRLHLAQQNDTNHPVIHFPYRLHGAARGFTGATASERVSLQLAPTTANQPPLTTGRHCPKLPATPRPPSISGAAGFRSPSAASLPEPGGCRDEFDGTRVCVVICITYV